MRPSYRDALPQLDGGFFVTDGGIETTLIFHEGLELPDFAAFDLLQAAGRRGGAAQVLPRLRAHRRALRRRPDPRERHLARERRLGRAPGLRRARAGRGEPPGDRAARGASATSSRDRHAIAVISGCVGPRGDGYQPGA